MSKVAATVTGASPGDVAGAGPSFLVWRLQNPTKDLAGLIVFVLHFNNAPLTMTTTLAIVIFV